MTFNAATRIAAAIRIQATTQADAGRLLTLLEPIFGKGYKKRKKGNLEEIEWVAPTYYAGITLDKDDYLSFHLIGRKGWDVDFDATFEDLGNGDIVKKIVDRIRWEASDVPLKGMDPAIKAVLQKLKALKAK
jgi:hypothetical protein